MFDATVSVNPRPYPIFSSMVCKFLFSYSLLFWNSLFLSQGMSGGAKVLGKLPVPGVLLIWIIVGQGHIALVVGAGGGCLDIFSLIYHFSFLSPSHWETARYRLKYCPKGPLSPKQPTKPTLWETARYRLKYCLKGPLSPKQPTNIFTNIFISLALSLSLFNLCCF